MLKLLIYGYLNQVRSSRKLERETKRNLEVIWLMEREKPDHWTINEFRRRYRQSFKQVLREFHEICDFLELFGREIEAIDGSFFKALNNKSKNFTEAKLKRMEAKIDAAIEKYLDDLDQEDGGNETAPSAQAESSPGSPSCEEPEPTEPVKNLVARGSLKELQAKKRRVEELRQGCGESESGQVSLSDEDSRLLRKGGQSVVGYNVQSVVDGSHHLIAHVEIVQAGNDAGQLEPMARAGCEALGIELDGESSEGEPVKILADGGYSNSAQVAACEKAGLEVHLPLKKKSVWGYRQFMVRGKEGCEGELNLMALCYNWTRVLNEVGLDRLMEAIRAVFVAMLSEWSRLGEPGEETEGFAWRKRKLHSVIRPTLRGGSVAFRPQERLAIRWI